MPKNERIKKTIFLVARPVFWTKIGRPSSFSLKKLSPVLKNGPKNRPKKLD